MPSNSAEPPRVLADVENRIADLKGLPEKVAARAALRQVYLQLRDLDLRSCGWPPLASSKEAHVDLLHADSQKLLSTVLRIDHVLRTVTVLKYVLKRKL